MIEQGRLISRSCTTSWLDWIHGELWVTPTAVVRSRLSLGATRRNGRASTPTVPTPAWLTDVPPHLSPDLLLSRHRTNRHILLSEVAVAALRPGVLNDRLSVTLRDSRPFTLLWLSVDPAFAILRDTLASTPSARFVVE
ncbi:MAG: hypothetical protein ABI083_17465 [Lapillicoccus sp.]